jgi:chromosome segregation ATPase
MEPWLFAVGGGLLGVLGPLVILWRVSSVKDALIQKLTVQVMEKDSQVLAARDTINEWKASHARLEHAAHQQKQEIARLRQAMSTAETLAHRLAARVCHSDDPRTTATVINRELQALSKVPGPGKPPPPSGRP